MAAIAAAELALTLMVLFWPALKPGHKQQTYHPVNNETHLLLPVITHQQSSPPPPPAPKVPVPVPNDQPIKVKFEHFPKKISLNISDSLSVTAGSGGQGKNNIVGNPAVGPRVVRIVEPSYENKTENRYEITVRFLVNKKGRVDEAKITAIYQLDENGNRTKKVTHINPVIRKKVIEASLNWRFKPAKDHGKPVRAYTKNYFTI
jgi:hypothetical protein